MVQVKPMKLLGLKVGIYSKVTHFNTVEVSMYRSNTVDVILDIIAATIYLISHLIC